MIDEDVEGVKPLKFAEYLDTDGARRIVSYDPAAPCRLCGNPVVEASMGGTDVCPWCDMGKPRPEEVTGQTAIWDAIVKLTRRVEDLERGPSARRSIAPTEGE